jgi:glutamate racemase
VQDENKSTAAKLPIGIFDSGVGGLTVVKQLKKLLPNEALIYFGDTARIPYGTKSPRLIQQYALEDALFLLQFDIKLLVIACNTASALALDVLLENLKIPVLGVVTPGAEAAVKETLEGKIGVLGTSATINSDMYAKEITKRNPNARISSQPCPLLVPLIEEGWINDEITALTLKKYLKQPLEDKVDTIIMGCTHYPLLETAIQKVTGGGVRLIDSGKETARKVKELLKKSGLLNIESKAKESQFYVSDIPDKFEEIGSLFLGEKLSFLERVDFDRFLISNKDHPFLKK